MTSFRLTGRCFTTNIIFTGFNWPQNIHWMTYSYEFVPMALENHLMDFLIFDFRDVVMGYFATIIKR